VCVLIAALVDAPHSGWFGSLFSYLKEGTKCALMSRSKWNIHFANKRTKRFNIQSSRNWTEWNDVVKPNWSLGAPHKIKLKFCFLSYPLGTCSTEQIAQSHVFAKDSQMHCFKKSSEIDEAINWTESVAIRLLFIFRTGFSCWSSCTTVSCWTPRNNFMFQ